jgi:hypothetical protein
VLLGAKGIQVTSWLQPQEQEQEQEQHRQTQHSLDTTKTKRSPCNVESGWKMRKRMLASANDHNSQQQQQQQQQQLQPCTPSELASKRGMKDLAQRLARMEYIHLRSGRLVNQTGMDNNNSR